MDAVEEKDEAMSSGTYRPGYCCCDGMLLAGTVLIWVHDFMAASQCYIHTVIMQS